MRSRRRACASFASTWLEGGDPVATTVLVVGTLDTKGAEVAFVADVLQRRGVQALVMDAGVFAPDSEAPAADVPAERVARAGGAELADLRSAGDRGSAMEAMQRGVAALATELHADGAFDGVLGLGGSGGTILGTAAMRALPVGVPKLMVSTVASGDVAAYVGESDVTMMYSVVDVAGINRLSRRVLANAAGMIAGAVEQEVPEGEDRPLLAATMFGVTTPCVDGVRDRLEAAGYEVLVFHATGSGGRAMEGLIRDGYIAAVADVTTTELADEEVGGVLSAGPDRLEAAGEAGIPQVVSVGALDMVNFWAADTVPERFRDRNLYRHNENVTLMRTTADECRRVGRVLADKVNAARGPVRVLLPGRGVSMIDADGQPFHDPAADEALFEAIRAHADPAIDVRTIDAHINDPAFSEAVADAVLDLLGRDR